MLSLKKKKSDLHFPLQVLMDLYYCGRVVKIESMSPGHFSVCLVFRATDLSTYLPYITGGFKHLQVTRFLSLILWTSQSGCHLRMGAESPQRLSVKRVHSVNSSENSLNDAVIQPFSTELRDMTVLPCSFQSRVWLARSTQLFLYLRATRHMQTVI